MLKLLMHGQFVEAFGDREAELTWRRSRREGLDHHVNAEDLDFHI
jgi:hypothetical protein